MTARAIVLLSLADRELREAELATLRPFDARASLRLDRRLRDFETWRDAAAREPIARAAA